MQRSLALALLLSIASPSVAAEAPLPDLVRAMLDAAAETGDPAQIEAVAGAARSVFPDYADGVAAYAAARIAAIAPPAPSAEPPAQAEDRGQAATGAGLFSLDGWDGKIGASAARASGNSDNVAVGLALDARREAGRLAHNLTGYIDLAEAQGSTTQKRWGAAYQLDYNFSDRMYAYGRIAFDEDQFSGFDYRLFAGAGLGYFIAKSEPFTLKVEGGPGYRISPIDDSRLTQNEFALYGAGELDWMVTEGVVFEQDVAATWTEATTTFSSITALTTTLTQSLSTGVAFEYRYETDPPPGRRNTDTILRATINYTY